MTLSEKILQLLDNQEAPVSQEWVREMMAEYPAFTLPQALLVKRSADELDAESLREIKLHLLLNSPDPTALADMVDLAGEDWQHLYPRDEEPATPSTESAIDMFLDTYGNQSESETAMLEQLIFNPVPADYFSDEDAPTDSDGLLLPPELFPNRKPAPEKVNAAEEQEEQTEEKDIHVTVVTNQTDSQPEDQIETPEATRTRRNEEPKPPTRSDDGLLSESLAKIFIKQRRYERAYEIISNLSLNFPEKSVYFADQMRFLQKLIKNQQYQQQNK